MPAHGHANPTYVTGEGSSANIPAWTKYYTSRSGSGWSVTGGSSIKGVYWRFVECSSAGQGGSAVHDNMPAYQNVYCWERIA